MFEVPKIGDTGATPPWDGAWLTPKTRNSPTCITTPNFVAVGHAVFAAGPEKIGDAGVPPLGMVTWQTPRNMLFTRC